MAGYVKAYATSGREPAQWVGGSEQRSGRGGTRERPAARRQAPRHRRARARGGLDPADQRALPARAPGGRRDPAARAEGAGGLRSPEDHLPRPSRPDDRRGRRRSRMAGRGVACGAPPAPAERSGRDRRPGRPARRGADRPWASPTRSTTAEVERDGWTRYATAFTTSRSPRPGSATRPRPTDASARRRWSGGSPPARTTGRGGSPWCGAAGRRPPPPGGWPSTSSHPTTSR